jgi:hypothetical protein
VPSSAPRALEVGDLAPAFHLKVSGEVFDPAADHVAGRPLLLVFRPDGAPLPDGLDALVAPVRALKGRCLFVAATAGAVAAGFELAVDADGKVAEIYGATDAARVILIAPNRRLAAIGADPAAVLQALERIAHRRGAGALTHHPPVLMLPDVLSPADCQRLIGVYAMQGHTFVEPGHGLSPAGSGDYKMRIPEYGRKDRIDHWIMTPETNGFIDDRLKRRLFGEIRKCFQYKITRREGYRIGCYEGERGGELHGHRDNSQPNVAHRRFACSINLNSEQFEGGGIRFPEFGDQEYQPETGMAVVFSSSLLHEPMHVTKGKRYVLLAFLYGEH